MHRPTRVGKRTEILIGSTGRQTVISLLGGGRWTHARVFHEACLRELAAGRPLVVDLSSCTQLDSTFLGTIQEIVSFSEAKAAPVRFQGLLPEVRGQFEELGMEDVLQRVYRDMLPLPGGMSPLTALGFDEVADRWRLVLAHEALAMLNERNHQEFVKLIERMRSELPERELAGHR